METTAVVSAAREALGPVGVFLPGPVLSSPVPAELQRQSVRRLEEAGYRTAWNNEGVGDKDAFVQLALMLANTERLVFGSAVANIWARSPQATKAAAGALAEAYPGRFVLGLGVGYTFQAESVGRQYGNPVATTRAYFEQMDAPPLMYQIPDVPYARVLAANGPKMLALAGEIADGAMPNVVPPTFTAHARQVLGPDKLLVIGLPTVPDDDPVRAKDLARQIIASSGGSHLWAGANLRRMGFTEEELVGGSDRVADAVIAHGGPAAIAAKVQEHLDAGADHVMVMPAGSDFASGIDDLVRLAPALIR
jgi:probable F420-dependent oxidoreductase